MTKPKVTVSQFSYRPRKVQEVSFDDSDRNDFLTGFRKRKNERRRVAQQQIKEKEREQRIKDRKKRKDMEDEKIAAFQRAKHQTMQQHEAEEENSSHKSSKNKPKQTNTNTTTTTNTHKSKLLVATPSANPFLSDQNKQTNELDFETLLDANEKRNEDGFDEIEIDMENGENDGKKSMFGQKSYKTQNEDEIVTTIVQEINFDDSENKMDTPNKNNNSNNNAKKSPKQNSNNSQQKSPSEKFNKSKVSKPFQQRQPKLFKSTKGNIAKRTPTTFSQFDKKKSNNSGSSGGFGANKKTAAFRK